MFEKTALADAKACSRQQLIIPSRLLVVTAEKFCKLASLLKYLMALLQESSSNGLCLQFEICVCLKCLVFVWCLFVTQLQQNVA